MTARQKLKAWRDREGMTQEQVATLVGVTPRTYQRWERGEGEPWLGAAVAIQQAGGPAVTDWVKEDA